MNGKREWYTYIYTINPYIWTFKLQTFKDANLRLHVQSCTLAHMPLYIVSRSHPFQVVELLCALLYSTVWSTVVRHLYFKHRTSRSKCKSSRDVAGTAKKHQAVIMEPKVKVIERVEQEVGRYHLFLKIVQPPAQFWRTKSQNMWGLLCWWHQQ